MRRKQTDNRWATHLQYHWWQYVLLAVLSIMIWTAVFDGLAKLEENGDVSKVGKFVYPSPSDAFDAACNALKVLL